jgi:transcriptional regulator with XRE-family HTH domain
MQEKIKQMAERIKELRQIFDVSATQLAQEFEVDPALYAQYESGAIDIPVSILYKLAHRFNVELTALITGEEPRLHTFALTRSGKGVTVERRKEFKYQSLAYNFIHKQAEPFLVVVDPPAKNEPVHYNSHPGQEFNFLLEGSMLVDLDGHEVTLNPGDSLYFDSGIKHGMKPLNGKPVRFLAIIF